MEGRSHRTRPRRQGACASCVTAARQLPQPHGQPKAAASAAMSSAQPDGTPLMPRPVCTRASRAGAGLALGAR